VLAHHARGQAIEDGFLATPEAWVMYR